LLLGDATFVFVWFKASAAENCDGASSWACADILQDIVLYLPFIFLVAFAITLAVARTAAQRLRDRRG